MSKTTRLVRYSLGEKLSQNIPEQRTAESFEEFSDVILSHRSSSSDGACFCGPMSAGPHDTPEKHLGQHHFRLASHALPRGFLVLDHDGYASSEAFTLVLDHLQSLNGFGYTTRKHTDTSPRARFILSLERDVDRTEGIRLGQEVTKELREKFGRNSIQIDESSYKAEQYAFCPLDNSSVFYFKGDPIRVSNYLQSPENSLISSKSSNSQGQQLGLRCFSDSEGYSTILGHLRNIDPHPEPIWSDVSNILARAKGESGRSLFLDFSAGKFWGTPYSKFSEKECNQRFDRSLRDLNQRPAGYGLTRLKELAYSSSSALVHSQSITPEPPPPTPRAEYGPAIRQALPVLNSNQKPLSVIENLTAVLQRNGVIAQYNQMKKRPEVIVPGLRSVSDELSNSTLVTVTDMAIKAGMSPHRIPEMLDAVASSNPYCPVRRFIESKPWDKTPRFEKFFAQLHVTNESMAKLLLRKWLIQAVTAVYQDYGFRNEGILVLSGPQGAGKTRLLRELASGVPDGFCEGQTLNPADKDSVATVISAWIVELGEIEATFRKADLAQLKAFSTKDTDTFRRPYAKRDSNHPRRTVFAGTVNDPTFLNDPTGNRRFWPIEIVGIDRDDTLDHQQLWAEVLNWYRNGETHFLADPEKQLLNDYNHQFMVNDPEIERLFSVYHFFKENQEWVERTMTDICHTLNISRPNTSTYMKLAATIRKFNGGKSPRKSNGKTYHLVPKIEKEPEIF